RRRHTSSKRDWSSDVCSSDLHMLIYPQRCYSVQPGRIVCHVGEFRLHVLPYAVPVHPQLPGNTFHGPVLAAHLTDCPPHCSNGEFGSALHQLRHILGDSASGAAFLGTDPPPPTPNQPHRSPKGGNIMQDPLLAAVPVGDQPAYSASFEVRGGFDGDHQPAMITNAFDGVQPLDS